MNTATKPDNRRNTNSRKVSAVTLAMLLLGGTANRAHAAPGDVDLSFDPGSGMNMQASAITALAGGKVLVAGDFTTVHGAMWKSLARLNADGSLDNSFVANLGGAYPVVAAFVPQSDGKVIIGGSFSSVNGVAWTNVARLNADGTLDNTFIAAVSGGDVRCILVQSDGRMLIGGSFTSVSGVARGGLAWLNADGTLDNTLLNVLTGFSGGYILSIALQTDGKVLVGGNFSMVNGVTRQSLVRLNSDGSTDTSFLSGLPGPNGSSLIAVSGFGLENDGKIVVAGYFQSFNGVTRTNTARLNSDGSLDESFVASLGISIDVLGGFILPAIVRQPDGKLLVGGSFVMFNGVPRVNLVRIDPDGNLDETFLRVGADSYTEPGVLFALQTDGKIAAAGRGSRFGDPSFPRREVFRLNADGSSDDTFNTGPTGPNAEIRSFAQQPDGRFLIGGRFTAVSGVARGFLARLMPDGSLDTTFLDGLAGADAYVCSIALQDDGRVLIGGVFGAINGVTRNGIARLNSDGSLDNSFSTSLPTYNYGYALALQTDGKIVLGGLFTSVNGTARSNLARLNPDGSLDGSFTGAPNGGVGTLLLQPDGNVVIGGSFSSVNGISRNRIARLYKDGALDASFLNGLSGADQAVFSIAVQNDGKTLVGGSFNTFNGVARGKLVRLNANGSVDNSFLTGMAGPNGGVQCLALQSDGKILAGGEFSSFNGVARGHLARLNMNGSLDSSFLSGLAGAEQKVWCLAAFTDGRIVTGGDFTVFNQVPRSFLARVRGDWFPPVIDTQPQSQTVEIGSDAYFRVSAPGSPAPSYEWFFNGTNALSGGSTNASLALTAVQLWQCGAYTVVVSNTIGAVTSAPAMLNVIPRVERRPVPGLQLTCQTGSLLHVEYASALAPTGWLPLDTVSTTSSPQWCFDLSTPLPPRRFYRAWQSGAPSIPPSLQLPSLIPALTLTGSVGSQVRVDGINAIGPTDAWSTLATVTLTSTSQLYFDISAPGQPTRLYRLVPVP